MAPKGKSKASNENPMLPPPIDLDHQPLVDHLYPVVETNCEVDLYKIHSWLKQNYLELNNDLGLWDSLLPQFIFLQTYYFPEFVTWCQFRYIPSQRTVVAQNGEIFFSINGHLISEMLQIQNPNHMQPFHRDFLMEMYNKSDLPPRAKIFETFLLENAQFPKTNPP